MNLLPNLINASIPLIFGILLVAFPNWFARRAAEKDRPVQLDLTAKNNGQALSAPESLASVIVDHGVCVFARFSPRDISRA